MAADANAAEASASRGRPDTLVPVLVPSP